MLDRNDEEKIAVSPFAMAGYGPKFREKSGGANGCGLLGGWYNEEKPVFIKQDEPSKGSIRHDKNICEVIAGRLMRLDEINKPYITNVNFIVPDNTQLPNEDGRQVYVKSDGMGVTLPEEKYDIDDSFVDAYDAYQIKFKNALPTVQKVYEKLYRSPYMDLWEDAYYAYNFAPEFEGLRRTLGGPIEIPASRPRMIETWNTHPLVDVLNSNRYKGLVEQIALRIFFDDPDQHTGNYGAMPIPGDPTKKQVAGIDFAAALERFDGSLHFRTIWRYLPGLGPTNHAREYPEALLINDAFAEQMKKLGNFPEEILECEIKNLMNEIELYYGIQPILETAKHMGAKITDVSSKEQILNDIENHLNTCIKSRQNHARQFYFEIKASLCFTKDENGEFYYDESQEQKLQELILDNSVYFMDVLKHGKTLKFRREDQKDDKSQDRLNFLLEQKIKYMLYGEKLASRSHSIFHSIFNLGKIERFTDDHGLKYFLKTMFGFPNRGNPYNWLEWSVLGFGIITFAKNSVKLATEYLPAVISHGFSVVRKQCSNYLEQPADKINMAMATIAVMGEALCWMLQTIFKIVQLTGMRITSPVQSFKQAYNFGNQYSKVLGLLCGGLSMTMTALAVIGLTFVAAPAIAALGGVVASTAIGAKVVAGLTAFGNALLNLPLVALAMQAAAATVTALGIAAVSAASLLSATLVSFAAFVTMPVRSIVKSSMKRVYRSFEPELVAPLIHDKTDDRFTHRRIGNLIGSETNSPTPGAEEKIASENGFTNLNTAGMQSFGIYSAQSNANKPHNIKQVINIQETIEYFPANKSLSR